MHRRGVKMSRRKTKVRPGTGPPAPGAADPRRLAADISRAAGSKLDLKELAREVVRLIHRRLDVQYVGLYYLDQSGECVSQLASAGRTSRRAAKTSHTVEVGAPCAIGQCLAQRKAVVSTAKGSEDPNRDLLPGTRSALALPLLRGGKAVGALSIQSRKADGLGERDISALQVLADQLAVAVENARLREQIEREIVERKRAQETLQERTIELEELTTELDAFAHTVAHDLKTPISAQVLLSSMLETNLRDMSLEKVHARLARITQAGFTMTAIIDSLLLLSSVRSEKVDSVPIDMSEVLPNALGRLSDLVAERGAEIVVADKWPLVLGHVPWVEEIWVNYLSNALKHGRQTSENVTPRVELGFDEPDDSIVRFRVVDNGPGIDPEQQAVLFAPFNRLA
ncbi:MAG: GAF domain-containing sensor histidine kinase, partial [Anaerolineales bacterium]